METGVRSVYVSYAWGGESDALVDAFQKRLPARFRLVRDKYSIQSGDWIDKFMRDIGRAELVLVVISEKYLESIYCMRELLHLHDRSLGDRSDFMARIVPLIVGDLSFSSVRDRDPYVEYWKKEHADLDRLLKRRGLDEVGAADRNELLVVGDIKQKVSDLLFWIDSALMPRGGKVHSDGVDAAIALFERRAKALGVGRAIGLDAPILPDEGLSAKIPDPSESTRNGQPFPGGDAEVADTIPPDAGPADTSEGHGQQTGTGSPEAIRDFHKKKAIERLDAPGARAFLEAVLQEFADEFPTPPKPGSANELVERFAGFTPESVEQLFFVVRRALGAARPTSREEAAREPTEAAAVALYCLAACRLVDRETIKGGYVHRVPTSEVTICGLIATVLTGLELRFEPSEDPDSPRPTHVYPVLVPPGSESVAVAFERASYIALFRNRSTTTLESQDCGPLNEVQRKDLAARIRTIMGKDRQTLALVVHGSAGSDEIGAFAEGHRLPVMLPSPEVTAALVGMEVGDFLADTREFWRELNTFRNPEPSSVSSPSPL